MLIIIARIGAILIVLLLAREAYISKHMKTEEICSDMYNIFSFSQDLHKVSYLESEEIIHCKEPFIYICFR